MIALHAPFARGSASACLGACLCALGAAAGEPAGGGPSSSPPAFGLDSAKAYAHAGIEGFSAEGTAGAHQRTMALLYNTAAQGLLQAHAYRLEARLGAGSAFPKGWSSAIDGTSGSSAWASPYTTGLGEASLRLRWGPPEADEGIQVGLMPLQGNPDAVLYGNYLARHGPYLSGGRRRLEAWDSLGTLTPRVSGLRLAWGPVGGLLRGEGWVARDGEDWNWLAFLSGRAPRSIDWGLGASGMLTSAADVLLAPGKGIANGDTSRGGFILDDSLPAPADTVTYSLVTFLLSARAALDLASLLGADMPQGRYGGVFVEAALLGWKDVPYYFPDRASRLTWTAGMRVPAFGWLDVCVAQAEWRREPEDSHAIFTGSWIPANSPRPRRASPWRTALLLGKRIGPHVELQARAATFRPSSGRETTLLGRIAFHLP